MGSKLPHYWEFLLAGIIGLYFLLYTLLQSDVSQLEHLNKHLTVIHKIQNKNTITNTNYPISDTLITSSDSALVDGSNYSQFAYILYATSIAYLNLAVINLIALRLANTKIPNLVVLYTQDILYESDKIDELFQLGGNFNILFKIVPRLDAKGDSRWQHSFTKFQVFNQLKYEKIVYFDADSILINFQDWNHNGPQNLDELFILNDDFDFALPQAYWLSNNQGTHSKQSHKYPKTKKGQLRFSKHKYGNSLNFFANHIMVINKPNVELYRDLLKLVYNPWWWKLFARGWIHKADEYDMDILNKYLDYKLRKGEIKVGILPHKIYGVLSGEFNEKKHARFVAEAEELPFIDLESNEGWDALQVIKQAKLVHFSDEPIPKPWQAKLDNNEYYSVQRAFCINELDKLDEQFPFFKPWITEDCDTVKVWDWIRKEFEVYRKDKWIAE